VLESEAYPNIVFRPERIEGTLSMQGMSKVTLHGTITMHGDEHPLALPSQVTIEDKTLNITSTFNVPYVEWGMHNPSMFILRVAKEVAVTIKASVPIESAVSAP
jgi:polyisoprenoid-binding protein YceI